MKRGFVPSTTAEEGGVVKCLDGWSEISGEYSNDQLMDGQRLISTQPRPKLWRPLIIFGRFFPSRVLPAFHSLHRPCGPTRGSWLERKGTRDHHIGLHQGGSTKVIPKSTDGRRRRHGTARERDGSAHISRRAGRARTGAPPGRVGRRTPR